MADLHTRIALLEAQLEHARHERDTTLDSIHVLLNSVSTHKPFMDQTQWPSSLVRLAHFARLSTLEPNAFAESLARIVEGVASLTSTASRIILRDGGAGDCNVEVTRRSHQLQPAVDLLDSDLADGGITRLIEYDASPPTAESNHPTIDASLPKVVVYGDQYDQRTPKPALPTSHFQATDHRIESPAGPRRNITIDDVQWKPSEGLRHIYRTVLLTNLPSHLTAADILKHVAGGIPISLKVGKFLKPNDTLAASVEFFTRDSAEDYVAFRNANMLVIGETKINVEMIKTPTWPVILPVVHGIEAHILSRCLVVYTFPRHISDAKLKSTLSQPGYLDSHGLVSIFEDEHGILHLSFKSIHAAESARYKLVNRPLFAGCIVEFERDHCDQSVSSLLKPQKPQTALPTQCWDTKDQAHFPDVLEYGEREASTSASDAVQDTPSGSSPASEPQSRSVPTSEMIVGRRSLISYADVDEHDLPEPPGFKGLAPGVQDLLPLAPDSDSETEDRDDPAGAGMESAEEGELVELSKW